MASENRTIILTRPWQSSIRLRQDLAGMLSGRVDILLSPLLKTVRLETDIDLTRFSAAVFSSANGLKALTGNRPARGAAAYCVGDQTAAAAAAEGYRAISANGSASDLAELIAARWNGEKTVYICGKSTAFDLPAHLSKRGVPIDVAVIYDQTRMRLNSDAIDAATGGSCLFPVYSARTGRILVDEARSIPDNCHVLACMSEKIVQEVLPLGWKTVVASRPDGESMMDLVFRWHKADYGKG